MTVRNNMIELTNETISGAIISSRAILASTVNTAAIALFAITLILAFVFVYAEMRKKSKVPA